MRAGKVSVGMIVRVSGAWPLIEQGICSARGALIVVAGAWLPVNFLSYRYVRRQGESSIGPVIGQRFMDRGEKEFSPFHSKPSLSDVDRLLAR